MKARRSSSVLALLLPLAALAPRARAADAPPVAPPPAPPAATLSQSAPPPAAAPALATGPRGAAELLAAADAAVEAGDLAAARSLYARLAAEHPGTSEAREARRALRILDARLAAAPAGAPPPAPPAPPVVPAPAPPPASDDVIIRQEPFSRRTSERLRLTTWEKLDFGVTSFLYGMSVGFSYGLSLENPGETDVVTPVALGATLYTLGAVAYLKFAHPDRGDLPLALAITSYVPTTALLASNIVFDEPNARRTSLAVAAAGLLSVPFAVEATRRLELDPGDTQLVRDAGFWGLVLGTTGALGFGGSTRTVEGFVDQPIQEPPSGRMVAGMGAAGLYGGLALGAVAATQTEISLERVRVSTWGGYGGGLIGALFGLAGTKQDYGVYRGLCIGAAAGLLVTFVTTGGLDGIPPETPVVSWLGRSGLSPALLPVSSPVGGATAWGFAGRF
jgi:hypothetical protein